MVAAATVTAGLLASSAPPTDAAVPHHVSQKSAPSRTGAASSHSRVSATGDGHRRARADSTYLVYDSTTPASIPAHQVAAVYSNGRYRPSGGQVPRGVVLWIDVDASDPSSDVLDVEPGNAVPSSVAPWVRERISRHSWSTPIIYTMRSEWAAAKASAGTLPAWMRSRVRWWIADPTGRPHLLPGSSATQWYWGDRYDISTARADLTTLTG